MLNGILRARAMVALGLVLSTHALQGQVRSQYRDYQLGSDLASVAALANVAATEARTIHQRPAVIQELAWRRPYFVSGTTALQKSYASEFRAIVTSARLDALARTADAQAIRLDEREAPQREIARQKKEMEDSRVSQEKARIANRAVFRP